MSASPAERRSFFKLSGAGNDFIALTDPAVPPGEHEVRTWCRRGLSLGADGVFTLTREAGAVRMVHYNADGSRAELCLNGSRCAAALAFHLGWAERVAPEARKRQSRAAAARKRQSRAAAARECHTLRLATDAGVLRARQAGCARVAIELPDIVGEPAARTLRFGGKAYCGWLLSVGVPHFVLPWPDGLARAPVDGLGKILRAHPDLGDAGANVDFVRFTDPARCELRTYERGVEAETLACGTGVVATVAAGVAAGALRAPATVLTAGGYELVVHTGGDAPRVLEGDARILARGEMLGGGSLPSPPAWTSSS